VRVKNTHNATGRRCKRHRAAFKFITADICFAFGGGNSFFHVHRHSVSPFGHERTHARALYASEHTHLSLSLLRLGSMACAALLELTMSCNYVAMATGSGHPNPRLRTLNSLASTQTLQDRRSLTCRCGFWADSEFLRESGTAISPRAHSDANAKGKRRRF
jgi:hypothetical protein